MAKKQQAVERQPVTVTLEVVPNLSIVFPDNPELAGSMAVGLDGSRALANARSLVARQFPASQYEVTEHLTAHVFEQDVVIPAATSIVSAITRLWLQAMQERTPR